MSSEHQQARQLGRQNAFPGSSFEGAVAQVHRKRLAAIAKNLIGFAALAGLVILLIIGWAQQLDAQAEERAINRQLANHMQEVERDKGWLTVVAKAYAQGRDDALKVKQASPEAFRLSQACSSLKSSGARP